MLDISAFLSAVSHSFSVMEIPRWAVRLCGKLKVLGCPLQNTVRTTLCLCHTSSDFVYSFSYASLNNLHKAVFSPSTGTQPAEARSVLLSRVVTSLRASSCYHTASKSLCPSLKIQTSFPLKPEYGIHARCDISRWQGEKGLGKGPRPGLGAVLFLPVAAVAWAVSDLR